MKRTDVEPASHLIGRFEYLNPSAREEAERVRVLLEQMIANYPEDHSEALICRIRSRDERAHVGAVFELGLHELLLRRGFQIVEIEPTFANGRAPDFLVQAPDDSRFYLEATVAWGDAVPTDGAARRRRDALQAIDDVLSKDFFLSLHARGVPATQIATGKLRRRVQDFVDKLDHDAVTAAIEGGQQAPLYQEDLDGLNIVIEPVPKNIRGTGGRAIGIQMLPGGVVQPHLAIASSLAGKAGRYGELDLPYIIAVTAMETFANEDSAVDALFGTEAVLVNANGHAWVRNPDGLWRGPNGPINTRVSAVMFTRRLSAWDFGQRALTLMRNPWATRPLPDVPLSFPTKHVIDDKLVAIDGLTTGQVLGLSDEWPETAS
jgi:hypothetical protein